MQAFGPKPGTQKRLNKLNKSGLGRSLVKSKKSKKQNPFQSDRHTTESDEKDLRSLTQERALEEFLHTAELSSKDFTTERTANIKIIQSGGQVVQDPFVLSEEQRKDLVKRHYENAGKLTVPRRPQWTSDMTAHELDRLEREAFLHWRRSLAELQDNNDLLLTPFERNVEVWRQLWRVVDRSDLVVQIVDARNPVLFRSVDLDNYVSELSTEERPKSTLLLVNKADLLNERQRQDWAKYFEDNNLQYVFFSAKVALDDLEANRETSLTDVISINELEELLIKSAPPAPREDRQLQVGLVGYPNVGKSSTINALIGSKKVSVSSTPGKTKHFQTIKLSEEVMLCDCPGLVFPNFAQTNGDLVCNGVLPIDQLREYNGPVSLVCERVPKYFIEAVYGIHIHVKPKEDGGNGVPTPYELLTSYARARGYTRTGGGDPDASRAARLILKDYVNGKLLYCEPPPNYEGDFNKDKYEVRDLPEARQLQIIDAIKQRQDTSAIDLDTLELAKEMDGLKFSAFDNTKERVGQNRSNFRPETIGEELDDQFFSGDGVNAVSSLPFHQQKSMGSSKKHFKGRKGGK